MAIPRVELRAQSAESHLLPVYTGLLLLHRAGRIRMRQRLEPRPGPRPGPAHLRDVRGCHLRVVLDGHIRIQYDTHDSWEIVEEYLQDADFYFKRSYAPDRLEALGVQARRVHPLGLNWAVYPHGVDGFGLRRGLAYARGLRRVSEVARALNLLDRAFFTPRLGRMTSAPCFDQPPRVLFLARTFDPQSDPTLSREKIEERESVNESRARCIAALRREFSDRFYGGFVHTPHAVRNYREYLAPEKDRCAKGRYIDLMRSFPICVATTGIHGSIGWKFAEYVAFSKAIVAERLNYKVPGDLEAGRNYLEFTSLDECLAQVGRLLDDRGLRQSMMVRNAEYFARFARPDALVMNTLSAASGSARPG